MNTLIKFIKVDWKSILCKRNLVVMGLIAIVVLIFVQSGVYKYGMLQKDKKEFQEIERLKVESYKRVKEFAISFQLTLTSNLPNPIFQYSNIPTFHHSNCVAKRI